MKICFVGTRYHGSQIQRNANTVQAEFQRALQSVLGVLPDIKCCSRTDAGVHAHAFYISFHHDGGLAPDRVPAALNNRLPADIRAICCRRVDENFHARYSALGKRYVYRIWNAPVMDPFENDRAAWFRPHIDEVALTEIAQAFVGRHDFSAFCSVRGRVDDAVRGVSAYNVTRRGSLVLLTVTADGFLYNMARAMAGALLNAARGRIDGRGIAERLAGGMRDNLIVTAPACGLYLDEVFYNLDGENRDTGIRH